jgi:hypothetical protein
MCYGYRIMRFNMRKFLLILPFLAAACATGPGLESRMAAYIGASPETLIGAFGVPDKQITVDGVQYFAYVRHRTQVIPGTPVFAGFGGYPYYGGFGGPVFATGIPPTVIDRSCETTFLLHDNKVVSFTLRGNDCN